MIGIIGNWKERSNLKVDIKKRLVRFGDKLLEKDQSDIECPV